MTTLPVMSITDEQIAEIEALADNAKLARSGNPWFTQDDCCWWTGNADEGDFMAAASPQIILALITRLREAEADTRRYRWLRNPDQDVALVLDKVTGEVPTDKFGGGGYRIYEYRAGGELDNAIDAAMERTP